MINATPIYLQVVSAVVQPCVRIFSLLPLHLPRMALRNCSSHAALGDGSSVENSVHSPLVARKNGDGIDVGADR
jgi:hypothetical protein